MPSGIHMRLAKHRQRMSEQKTKHGDNAGRKKTALYNTWATMKQRCCNPASARYKTYGAKGIRICEEWKDYLLFRNWAMYSGYKDGMVIHRIDHDKNYQPENCIFISKGEHDSLPKPHSIKITDEQIRKVYRLSNQGMRIKQLAQMFSVTKSTISFILRGTGCVRYQKLHKELQNAGTK